MAPLAQRIGRGLRAVRLSLRALREAVGKTQTELAEIVQTDQGEISRIEHRDDVLLSTLRRYVEALGGKLEVVATFDNGRRRIVLDLEAS